MQQWFINLFGEVKEIKKLFTPALKLPSDAHCLDTFLRFHYPSKENNTLTGIRANKQLKEGSLNTIFNYQYYQSACDEQEDWHTSQVQILKAIKPIVNMVCSNDDNHSSTLINLIDTLINIIQSKKEYIHVQKDDGPPIKTLMFYLKIIPKYKGCLHKKQNIQNIAKSLLDKNRIIENENLTLLGTSINNCGTFIKNALKHKLNLTDKNSDVLATLIEKIIINALGYSEMHWAQYYSITRSNNTNWAEQTRNIIPEILKDLIQRIKIRFAYTPCAANTINNDPLQLCYNPEVPNVVNTKHGQITPLVFIALHEAIESAILLYAWEKKLIALKKSGEVLGYRNPELILEIGYNTTDDKKLKRSFKAFLDHNNLLQFTYTLAIPRCGQELIELENHAILRVVGKCINNDNCYVITQSYSDLCLREQGEKMGIVMYQDAHIIAEQCAIETIIACGFDYKDLDIYFDTVINKWIFKKVIPKYQKVYSKRKMFSEHESKAEKEYLDKCLVSGFPLPYLCYMDRQSRESQNTSSDSSFTFFTLAMLERAYHCQ